MAVLAAVFWPAARAYTTKYGLAAGAATGIYAAFVAALGMALAPAFLRARWMIVVPLCWAPYLIYAAATGDFRWLALAKLAGITALLVLLYVPWPVRNSARFAWQDAGAAIVLIAVVLSGWLRGIWNVPVNLDFMNRLFLIAAAGWTWTVVRPVPELGYELRISRKVLLEAGRSFVLFAVIAIPLR